MTHHPLRQDVFDVNLGGVFTLIGGCSSLGGVLKCRFYYYLAMVRPTEQEMVAIEKVACYLQFPSGGSQPCCSGHMGSTQVGQRHGEQGGNLDKSVYCPDRIRRSRQV